MFINDRCTALPLFDDLGLENGRADETELTRTLPEPTEAIPGTIEKIEVLRLRLESGERLHHSEDRGAIVWRVPRYSDDLI